MPIYANAHGTVVSFAPSIQQPGGRFPSKHTIYALFQNIVFATFFKPTKIENKRKRQTMASQINIPKMYYVIFQGIVIYHKRPKTFLNQYFVILIGTGND